jgi:molybdate transport system substrate-binding protein
MKKLLIAMTFASLFFASTAMAADVNVFAAASLKNAIDEIGAAWKAKSGNGIVATYAASSALAKQIEAAAPADVFISADEAWMDELASKNLIKTESRKDIVGNTLVIVAAKDSKLTVDLGAKPNLVETLGQDKLAMADVKAVPAGKYGKAALESLKLWDAVSPQVAMQENVRAALALVATGEAKLGIVYGSDAAVEPKVEVTATFADETHTPILYPAAIVAASTNADAQGFVDFLKGDEAKVVFKKDGFKLLD